MAASTELNIILRDAAKTPLLRMTSEIASQALRSALSGSALALSGARVSKDGVCSHASRRARGVPQHDVVFDF